MIYPAFSENRFLAKTKLHLRKGMSAVQNLRSRPTAMVVAMERGKGNATDKKIRADTENNLGRDVEKIELEQVHDLMNGQMSRHVMILGEAGAGKSTFSKTYALAVSEGNVNALRDIKLVHLVEAATLQSQAPSNAFQLFFDDQMAHDPSTKLTLDEVKAGREWIARNSDKAVIIIDGLDQCIKDFGKVRYPVIHDMNKAKANDLIANIMSGKIWGDARILTTSRWNVYWNLTIEQMPDRVIGLRGFDDDNLQTAAECYLQEDGSIMLDQLRLTSPSILNVCRNPVFLKYMATIFDRNHNDIPDSLSGLMSAFFRNFIHSYNVNNYDNITKLAYHGILDNLFALPYRYVSNLGINPEDFNQFLSPGAILEDGHDNVTWHDKFFVFSHQTMQVCVHSIFVFITRHALFIVFHILLSYMNEII